MGVVPATPPPSAELLTARLVRPGGPWARVDVVAATGSTNADLAERARAGAPHGTVLVTDDQTAGRGRLARTWSAPPGVSVATSVLLRPPASVGQGRWSWLPLMTGVAVAAGVRAVSGLAPELKWPNDVLVAGRKLCGLLAEVVRTPSGPAVVLGWGINVSMGADELPVPTATSLLLEGAVVDKTALVAGVLDQLAPAYALWLDDPAALRAAYERDCATIGCEVRVELPRDELVVGTAVGVDDTGALRVRTPGGERAFAAGDVVHLRPR